MTQPAPQASVPAAAPRPAAGPPSPPSGPTAGAGQATQPIPRAHLAAAGLAAAGLLVTGVWAATGSAAWAGWVALLLVILGLALLATRNLAKRPLTVASRRATGRQSRQPAGRPAAGQRQAGRGAAPAVAGGASPRPAGGRMARMFHRSGSPAGAGAGPGAGPGGRGAGGRSPLGRRLHGAWPGHSAMPGAAGQPVGGRLGSAGHPTGGRRGSWFRRGSGSASSPGSSGPRTGRRWPFRRGGSGGSSTSPAPVAGNRAAPRQPARPTGPGATSAQHPPPPQAGHAGRGRTWRRPWRRRAASGQAQPAPRPAAAQPQMAASPTPAASPAGARQGHRWHLPGRRRPAAGQPTAPHTPTVRTRRRSAVPGAEQARRRARERLADYRRQETEGRARAAAGRKPVVGDPDGGPRRDSPGKPNRPPARLPWAVAPPSPTSGPQTHPGGPAPPASGVPPPPLPRRSRKAELYDSIALGGPMPEHLHSMINGWPPLIASNHEAVDEVVTRLQRTAAAVEGSPSHRAVADRAKQLAGEATRLHAAIDDLDALSRSADAIPRQAAEQVRGRPDPQAWHRE